MADKTTTQSQHNPFQALFETVDAGAHLERAKALHEEFNRQLQAGAERTVAAIDEAARMAKDTMGYAMKLSTSLSELSLETLRRTTDWAQSK